MKRMIRSAFLVGAVGTTAACGSTPVAAVSAPPAVVIQTAKPVASALADEPAPQRVDELHVIARFEGTPPPMPVPRHRQNAEYCKDELLAHDAVKVSNQRLADVIVWLEPGVDTPAPARGATGITPTVATIRMGQCQYRPRAAVVALGGKLTFENDAPTLMNVHLQSLSRNYALPQGGPAYTVPDENPNELDAVR
jgi:hypothetical protein